MANKISLSPFCPTLEKWSLKTDESSSGSLMLLLSNLISFTEELWIFLEISSLSIRQVIREIIVHILYAAPCICWQQYSVVKIVRKANKQINRRQWNEGNRKLYHIIEKTSQNT